MTWIQPHCKCSSLRENVMHLPHRDIGDNRWRDFHGQKKLRRGVELSAGVKHGSHPRGRGLHVTAVISCSRLLRLPGSVFIVSLLATNEKGARWFAPTQAESSPDPCRRFEALRSGYKHNGGRTFSTLYMLMLNTEQSNMEIISLRQLLISISRKHCISIHLSCDSGLLITAWVQYPPSF